MSEPVEPIASAEDGTSAPIQPIVHDIKDNDHLMHVLGLMKVDASHSINIAQVFHVIASEIQLLKEKINTKKVKK